MKKFSLIIISITLVSGTIIFNSCKKEDTSTPVVTLIGDAHIYHVLNQAYVDPGALATDDGSTIDAVIETNTVEINTVGDYKVVWSAVDGDGNKGTAERTVSVYNEANPMIGPYDIHVKADSAGVIREYDYTDNVGIHGKINNQIYANNFNNYPNTVVFMDITGTDIAIANQTVGVTPNQKTFSGWGFIDETSGNFEVHIMEIVVTPTQYSIQTVVTYIKK